jgi:hypothetical protein
MNTENTLPKNWTVGRGLFPDIASEIERSIRGIVKSHEAEIRRRKAPHDLLAYWIRFGAENASYSLGKPARRKAA